MIETLLGGLLGGLFRLTPELLKWLDRSGERRHELAMQDKALEFEKLRGTQRMSEMSASATASWNQEALQALQQAISAQGQRSGVGWADALSCSVRPIITYWFMALYCAAKTAALVGALNNTDMSWVTAIQAVWSEADQALWAGILNFWFLARTLDKMQWRR